jgi:mannose-6-phosphate isomerase-like protein (cupin superfamily)
MTGAGTYRFRSTSVEVLPANPLIIQHPASTSMKIVEKPWGREIWVAHTDKYAFKIIEVNKGTRSSLQYHVKKHEHIYVDRGILQIEWENESGEMEVLTLKPGDTIENKPGRKHRVTAIEDVRILEVSTPELDDVVRVEDDYRRS